MGQYKEALQQCEDYMNLSQNYYEEGHPALLSMLNNKGVILSKIG